MRKVICCLALLAGPLCGSAEEVCTFDVRQRNYLVSTVFEINGKDRFLGSIIKESLHLRTQYDLYDEAGGLEAKGICRFLSLGTIFSWGTSIDVYDEREKQIGAIEGQVITGAAAKFNIYDAAGAHVAIAYLDRSGAAFTIRSGRMPAASNSRIAPRWARPRDPPPPKTSAILIGFLHSNGGTVFSAVGCT